MTDLEALKHILRAAEDSLKTIDIIPFKDVETIAHHAGVTIAMLTVMLRNEPNAPLNIATALVGLQLKAKFGGMLDKLIETEEKHA